MLKKILIANRGEIAVRVVRACREMGIKTVAVYSAADRVALHVRMADEAYFIGPAPSTESYLNIERIIDVARKSGADAIHPGYGFLAENPEFASAVQQAGLIFIGPAPEAIRLFGDKMAARERMLASGVPVVPGMEQNLTSDEAARKIADEIGFPVLIKAAAGGGGKGMRIVHSPDEMAEAMKTARAEAKSAFGDDRIYLEKYIARPRHIEVQILADHHGNVMHLGERECSIQRRHQKVIEESPSPIVDSVMRERMGAVAIKAAKAGGYTNAGTVEFLYDQDGRFYFLEVNTRLQVEHPVTELITGVDLVKAQIKIAAGESIQFQTDISRRGAAIECRIYAEDPENNFFPSIGKVQTYREPGGPGVRVDSGMYEGGEVSIYYDPLIAKLLTWGPTRIEAINRMRRALAEYRISGVKTTIPFHIAIMGNERFIKGDLSTHFIAEEYPNGRLNFVEDESLMQALAIFSCVIDYQENRKIQPATISKKSNLNRWKMQSRW